MRWRTTRCRAPAAPDASGLPAAVPGRVAVAVDEVVVPADHGLPDENGGEYQAAPSRGGASADERGAAEHQGGRQRVQRVRRAP